MLFLPQSCNFPTRPTYAIFNKTLPVRTIRKEEGMTSFSTVAGGIVSLPGFFCILQGWKNFSLARAIHGWIQTTGVITRATLRKVKDSERRHAYEALITYNYSLGDTKFSCSTIAVGKERMELTEMESLALHQRYPLHWRIQLFLRSCRSIAGRSGAGKRRQRRPSSDRGLRACALRLHSICINRCTHGVRALSCSSAHIHFRHSLKNNPCSFFQATID